MDIRTLEGVGLEQLHSTFHQAFSDYAEPWNKTADELKRILDRRGYLPELSFGVFDGEELVSFTLNGIGEWNGEQTAYDTGTGTIKEFRGQGLVTRMFDESIPVLKENGIKQYLLEVIRVNTKAFELYKRAGFEVVRELDYYITAVEGVQIDEEKLTTNYIIKELSVPDWQLFTSFHDFQPSWQNSVDAIARVPDHFKFIAAYDNNAVAGYGIIEPSTGDIPHLAVAKPHRRKGIGTMLVHWLLQYNQSPVLKFINAEATYEPFKSFMNSISLTPGHGQYEMMRKL